MFITLCPDGLSQVQPPRRIFLFKHGGECKKQSMTHPLRYPGLCLVDLFLEAFESQLIQKHQKTQKKNTKKHAINPKTPKKTINRSHLLLKIQHEQALEASPGGLPRGLV